MAMRESGNLPRKRDSEGYGWDWGSSDGTRDTLGKRHLWSGRAWSCGAVWVGTGVKRPWRGGVVGG